MKIRGATAKIVRKVKNDGEGGGGMLQREGGGGTCCWDISRNVTSQVAGKFKLNNEGFFKILNHFPLMYL